MPNTPKPRPTPAVADATLTQRQAFTITEHRDPTPPRVVDAAPPAAVAEEPIPPPGVGRGKRTVCERAWLRLNETEKRIVQRNVHEFFVWMSMR